MIAKKIVVLMFMLALGAIAAQAQGTLSKTTIQGPDLITDGVRELDLNNGKLEVAVHNVGQKASVKSLMRITVTPTDSAQTSRSKDVPVLQPDEVVWVPVSFDKPLNLAKYCAVADALKQNTETSEKNNQKCGQFSGKP